jgi:xylan 1,4-beta-xylosidase
MCHRFFLVLLLCRLSLCAAQPVTIDPSVQAHPFPHFWEQMFGSGRAILALRDSYRDDLRAVKAVTQFQYVRFHAIFHDEVGVYNEDEHGNPVYNFAYVDQIYDGLLRNGVRPVVEVSFMPKKLAFNPDALHPFWYKQNVSPPKDWERWDGLLTHFAEHLVNRYGIDEVAQWYFEVWNEPNIDFWNGIPRLQSYFELYDHTARDLKKVNARLRVGGPATAAAAWIPEFLHHVQAEKVPLDFVSSHGYADDTPENLFGSQADVPMDDRVCRAIAKVRNEINAAASSKLPLFWTEWNVQGMKESRDTTFVGPALANTIRQCDGQVDMMSFWTFSDVFEEGGPIPTPFEGHFGLRAEGGINKPSFYDFALLHQLGDERIPNPSADAIVTRRKDGTIAVALWNLVDPDKTGSTRTFELTIRERNTKFTTAHIKRVDDEHGNVLPVYRKMGSPVNPTPEQVTKLNEATQLPASEQQKLKDGHLTLTLEPNALALIELSSE